MNITQTHKTTEYKYNQLAIKLEESKISSNNAVKNFDIKNSESIINNGHPSTLHLEIANALLKILGYNYLPNWNTFMVT